MEYIDSYNISAVGAWPWTWLEDFMKLVNEFFSFTGTALMKYDTLRIIGSTLALALK